MTAVTSPGQAAAAPDTQRPADVFVAFGITGDLAKVMTLRALSGLECRGLLDSPIVGVAADDWTLDDLRERARSAVDAPPPVHPYAQGTWGPAEADALLRGHGRWHEPWTAP
jgi:glucose-6-phosphate 1-dehydrogenase